MCMIILRLCTCRLISTHRDILPRYIALYRLEVDLAISLVVADVEPSKGTKQIKVILFYSSIGAVCTTAYL